MDNTRTADGSVGQSMPDPLKTWVMVVLTLIFIALYGAALLGWLRPLTDDRMVVRLEPIIFVIIGYYFGRLPAQQNENTLKGEIERQTVRADGAEKDKTNAQSTSVTLQERVRSVRAALTSAIPKAAKPGVTDVLAGTSGADSSAAIRQSVAAALSILEEPSS